MHWQDLFLNPEGRIGRRDFWLGFFALLGIFFLLQLLPGLGTLVSLGLFYCWICLFSKRLHDFGKSGWMQVFVHAINLVCLAVIIWLGALFILTNGIFRPNAAMGVLMGGVLAGAAVIIAALAVALINTAVFVIWLGTREGDEGATNHGAPQTLIP